MGWGLALRPPLSAEDEAQGCTASPSHPVGISGKKTSQGGSGRRSRILLAVRHMLAQEAPGLEDAGTFPGVLGTAAEQGLVPRPPPHPCPRFGYKGMKSLPYWV